MDERYQHIIHYIRNVAHELTTSAMMVIRGATDKVTALRMKFVGGAYNEGVISLSGESKTIVVPLTVDPTKHSHTTATILNNSMYGTNANNINNTMVLRTNDENNNDVNNIHANGKDATNTGYKLSDGRDISTLFQKKNNANFSIQNVNNNSPSGNNAITDMTLYKNGNTFVLARSWGWVCNCNFLPFYCRCCD